MANATGYAGGGSTLSITDVENLTLTLNKSTVHENDGPNAAELTVRRSNSDLGSPLQVSLASSLLGELSFPATVQIPANASSVTIPIGAVDDTLLDGLKNGSLVASAGGYVEGAVTIRVEDAESLLLQLDRSSISENGGQIVGTVRRSNTDTESALSVIIGSNAVSRLSYPATVVIPSGSQSANFTIVAVDDQVLQGDVQVELQASKSGYTSAMASFQLRDLETLELDLTNAQIAEKMGTTQLIVSRSDVDSPNALQVQLSVDRSDLVQIPASVTIPARQRSVSVSLVAIDDFLFDGDATLKITATAAAFKVPNRTLSSSTKRPRSREPTLAIRWMSTTTR